MSERGKRQKVDDEDGVEVLDVVFLDIDGVLLPFDPADDSADSQFDDDLDSEDCNLCTISRPGQIAWACDECAGCFCSMCRSCLFLCCFFPGFPMPLPGRNLDFCLWFCAGLSRLAKNARSKYARRAPTQETVRAAARSLR